MQGNYGLDATESEVKQSRTLCVVSAKCRDLHPKFSQQNNSRSKYIWKTTCGKYGNGCREAGSQRAPCRDVESADTPKKETILAIPMLK